MSRPLHVEVSDLARAQIRAAEEWWRVNRPKAPSAIREELERASLLISVQPEIGARAKNASLAGVRRLHLARVRLQTKDYDSVEEFTAALANPPRTTHPSER